MFDRLPIIGPWIIKRDEKKFRQWQAFIDTRQQGCEIFQLIGVRQRARTGLKAYGRWLFDGHTSALWIEGDWPATGTFMAASGSYGRGDHHGENVFYVEPPYTYMDSSCYAAMQRHVKRMSRPLAKAAHS